MWTALHCPRVKGKLNTSACSLAAPMELNLNTSPPITVSCPRNVVWPITCFERVPNDVLLRARMSSFDVLQVEMPTQAFPMILCIYKVNGVVRAVGPITAYCKHCFIKRMFYCMQCNHSTPILRESGGAVPAASRSIRLYCQHTIYNI